MNAPLSPVTVPLTKPLIDSFKRPISALRIVRELEVGDLIDAEGTTKKTERTLIFVQRLCRTQEGNEVPFEDLRHMRPEDLEAVALAMLPFMGNGPTSGESSSAPSSSSAASPSTL